MRHLVASSSIAALALALAGCGGDDGDGVDVDATPIDASLDGAVPSNALGQVCAVGGTTCPAGHRCVTIDGVGSTTMGYCSPLCTNMNAICARDYTGPAGGMTFCALTPPGENLPNLCAIACTMPAHCPAGLACLAVPGSTTRVCAPPA